MAHIGTTARVALSMGFALMLGFVPEEARAGACIDALLDDPCVASRDIARNSLRHVDMKNASRAYFDLGNDAFDIPFKNKSYAQVELTPPSDGFLIITASVGVTAGLAHQREALGTVACVIKIGKANRGIKRLDFIGRFDGSANKRIKPHNSIAWSGVRHVKADKARKVAMLCRKGWLIATAVADELRSNSAGTVRCDVIVRQAGALIARKSFVESFNPEKGVRSTSMIATFGFPMHKKTTAVVELSCKALSGSVDFGHVRLTVQYFPTRY
jgi:hypothetical protein